MRKREIYIGLTSASIGFMQERYMELSLLKKQKKQKLVRDI